MFWNFYFLENCYCFLSEILFYFSEIWRKQSRQKRNLRKYFLTFLDTFLALTLKNVWNRLRSNIFSCQVEKTIAAAYLSCITKCSKEKALFFSMYIEYFEIFLKLLSVSGSIYFHFKVRSYRMGLSIFIM